jgi:hypothetical protein
VNSCNVELIETNPQESVNVLKGLVQHRDSNDIDVEIRRNQLFEKDYLLHPFKTMAFNLYPLPSMWKRIIVWIRYKMHII